MLMPIPETPVAVDGDLVTHDITCSSCGDVFRITAPKSAWDARANGARVQEAFPMLNSDQREILVSGICGPCFDEMLEDG